MKHKVLIIIATYNIGGPGKGIFQLIKQTDTDLTEFVLVNFLKTTDKTSEFIQEAKKQGIPIQIIRQKSRFDISMIQQAHHLYIKEGCDIIQTHGYKGHIIAIIMKLFYKVKWVSVAHGWTSENIRIKIYNSIERFLIRFSDVAIAVSPKLFLELKKYRVNKNTKLILNAVTSPPEPNHIQEEKIKKKFALKPSIVLGIFGRLSKEKGQTYAITALNELKKTKNNVKLVLLGEGIDEVDLKLQAKNLGLQDDVIFCGYQSNVGDYINMVDFVIVPSLSEGIPNIVLEALAMNKPVIGTNVGGIPEIIGHGKNGWLVEPAEPLQISNMLEKLLSSEEEVLNVTCAANESLFPKFSVETRVNKFIEAYNSIVQ